MAQARKIQTAPDAFRYSPGDGHTYTWDGTSATATVWRHRTPGAGEAFRLLAHGQDPVLVMERTGDTVSMDGVARTATAFMDAVDRYRQTRAMIRLPELLATEPTP